MWRPPRRRHGLPDAGVVTLEEQSDEEHAFGPAAQLVTEWRPLRHGDETAGSRVDRARAGTRRWELETELLRDFHLTLPPETEPLTQAGRADHLRWRLDALAEARAGTGRSEAGAHPATHIHPWPVVEVGSGPATSEQAIRGLGSFHAHGEVGVQAGRFGGDEAGHQRERRH